MKRAHKLVRIMRKIIARYVSRKLDTYSLEELSELQRITIRLTNRIAVVKDRAEAEAKVDLIPSQEVGNDGSR